jgi:hypothetical protein
VRAIATAAVQAIAGVAAVLALAAACAGWPATAPGGAAGPTSTRQLTTAEATRADPN